MPSLRSLLREQLTKRLVPLLLERGFDGPSTISGNARSHTYSRIDGSERHEIDITFEKYRAARFRLSLYAYPYPAPDSLRGKVAEIPTGSVAPKRGKSFRADPTIVEKLLRRDELQKLDGAVSACIDCLPEVDTWWQEKADTDHIKTLLLPGTIPE